MVLYKLCVCVRTKTKIFPVLSVVSCQLSVVSVRRQKEKKVKKTMIGSVFQCVSASEHVRQVKRLVD